MNQILKRLEEKKNLVMSHRGFWGGNIIQNTRQSAQLAYDAGADIVEADVCRSSDGKYYLFHNSFELLLLGIKKDFSQMDSKMIDSLEYLNSNGENSGFFVEKLKDFLEWLPEGALVNLDRSFFYWEDKKFFDIIENSSKANQIFIKSPLKDKFVESLLKAETGVAFVPIIKTVKDIDTMVQLKENLNIIGSEIILNSLNSELLAQNHLSRLLEYPLRVANLENLGTRFNLLGHVDDNTVLLNNQSQLNQLLELGFNTFQTDWPNFIVERLNQIME